MASPCGGSAESSGGMMNKFSALARDNTSGFLVRQNLLMLVAYALLAIAATFLAQPLVTLWTAVRSPGNRPPSRCADS